MSIETSKLFYCAILIVTLALSFAANKTKRAHWFWVGSIIFILTVVSGFRGRTVGIDTEGYHDVFVVLYHGYHANINGVADPGFLWITRFLLLATNSTQSPFVFWAFITNALIVIRLFGMRKRISFPFSMFVYYTSFYFLSFNLLRQFAAVAIIFMATKLLESQKYIKYSLLVALAATIHYSALLAFSILIIDLIRRRSELGTKWKMFLYAIFAALPILVILFIESFFSRYSSYSATITGNFGSIGLMVPLKLAVFAIFTISDKVILRIGSQNVLRPDERINGKRLIHNETILYTIGLIGYFLSYLIRYIDRVVYYQMIFELVCYGRYYKKTSSSIIMRCVLIAVALIPFVVLLMSNTGPQGELPYYFCWGS